MHQCIWSVAPNISLTSLRRIIPFAFIFQMVTLFKLHTLEKAIFRGNLLLNDVLLVPNFNCNLISIARLSNDLSCCITFIWNWFSIQELALNRTIVVGELKVVYCLRHMALFGFAYHTLKADKYLALKTWVSIMTTKFSWYWFIFGEVMNRDCDICCWAK